MHIFNFNDVQFIFFFLLLFIPLVSYLRLHYQIQGRKDLPTVPGLLSFMFRSLVYFMLFFVLV
jgi:hypothetical protein